MALTAQTGVAPNTRIVFEIAGSIPSYLPTGIFRDRLAQQVTMYGFVAESVTVTGGYGLTSRDYKAIVTIRTQAAVLNVNTLSGQIASAAEGAGSYSPTVTIPAIGQPSQAGPAPNIADTVVDALGKVVEGAGSAARGAGGVLEALPNVTMLLIVGIVVIVAFAASGPNVKSIARAVRP